MLNYAKEQFELAMQTGTYSGFFGRISDLKNENLILMTDGDKLY